MTKIFERPELQGQPGVHALIAGVSTYAHLPGGGGAAGELGNLQLAQLDGTARTAHDIYTWLRKADDDKRLPLPLASVRLLLSPSAGEANLNGVADACTWDTFAKELKAWRVDAAQHAKSMTFFYFAGHGLARWKGDSVLLMEDFANPDAGGALDRAIDMQHVILGMAPPADAARTIARSQLYFVDACRTSVSGLKKYDDEEARKPWPTEKGGKDDRSWPIFYASIPGDTAKLLLGQTTLFSEALKNCLDRLGATGPDASNPKYHVTTHSLANALTEAIAAVNEKYAHLGANQDFVPDGQNKKFTIVNLNAPPEVDVEVQIDPDEAVPEIALEIEDKLFNQVKAVAAGALQQPYRDRLAAGLYSFCAKPAQAHALYQQHKELINVALPNATWQAKVKP